MAVTLRDVLGDLEEWLGEKTADIPLPLGAAPNQLQKEIAAKAVGILNEKMATMDPDLAHTLQQVVYFLDEKQLDEVEILREMDEAIAVFERGVTEDLSFELDAETFFVPEGCIE